MRERRITERDKIEKYSLREGMVMMGKQRSGTKCRDGVQPETLTEEQGIEFHGSTSRTGKTDETVRGSRGRTLRDGSLKTSRLPQPGLLTEVECWPR